MTSKFCKILYIDEAIDEKQASVVLENATQNSEFPCVFTVVSNPFTGLECTEHTQFSVIFLAYTSEYASNFTPFDFQRVLRKVGATTPIILVLDEFECLPDYVFDSTHGFPISRTLVKPYTDRQLCEAIATALSPEDSLEPLSQAQTDHVLDCFDLLFGHDAVSDTLVTSTLSTPRQGQAGNTHNKAKAEGRGKHIFEYVKDSLNTTSQETKRQRSYSTSSCVSTTSSNIVNAAIEAVSSAHGSSASSASTEFDPDTIFQEEA